MSLTHYKRISHGSYSENYYYNLFLFNLQLKEAILNGTHPISQDQAINLAALQCQVEYGPMVPEKIKRNPIE